MASERNCARLSLVCCSLQHVDPGCRSGMNNTRKEPYPSHSARTQADGSIANQYAILLNADADRRETSDIGHTYNSAHSIHTQQLCVIRSRRDHPARAAAYAPFGCTCAPVRRVRAHPPCRGSAQRASTLENRCAGGRAGACKEGGRGGASGSSSRRLPDRPPGLRRPPRARRPRLSCKLLMRCLARLECQYQSYPPIEQVQRRTQ